MKNDVRISVIEEAIKLLEAHAEKNEYEGIKISLPPLFYDTNFLSKLMNVLYRAGFSVSNLDLDYYRELSNADDDTDGLWYNAKKNLRQSLEQKLDFIECQEKDQVCQAYELIKSNRLSRGFPMTMRYEEIISTSGVINTDFFLVGKDGRYIAAAVAYHVNETTIYIPYWGDINGHKEMKPMNFLSYKIFEQYKNAGKAIVHIGIATESSLPNYGLCEFKESIGCKITPKFTYFKKF